MNTYNPNRPVENKAPQTPQETEAAKTEATRVEDARLAKVEADRKAQEAQKAK